MSEWGIEQPSTFGNAGGCFVETFSAVGAILLVAGLASILPNENLKQSNNNVQTTHESVKTDVDTLSRDTVMYTPAVDAVFRDIEKQNEFLLKKTARDLNEIDRLARARGRVR